jgi:hypothetical protein
MTPTIESEYPASILDRCYGISPTTVRSLQTLAFQQRNRRSARAVGRRPEAGRGRHLMVGLDIYDFELVAAEHHARTYPNAH